MTRHLGSPTVLDTGSPQDVGAVGVSAWLAKRRTVIALGATVAGAAAYLAMNLVPVFFMTVLHAVTVSVRVTSGRTGQPVAGAVVELLDPNSGKVDQREVVDDVGFATFQLTVQEQPTWVLPPRGVIHVPWRVRAVDVGGNRSREYLVPDTTVGARSSRVTIAM